MIRNSLTGETYVQFIDRDENGFTLAWYDSVGHYETFRPFSFLDEKGKTRFSTEVLTSNVK